MESQVGIPGDFTTMCDQEAIFREGDEDPPPHVNSYESSLHFRAQNRQRAA